MEEMSVSFIYFFYEAVLFTAAASFTDTVMNNK